MNLAYENDTRVDTKERRSHLYAVQDAGLWVRDGTPLDRLLNNEEAPAKDVLVQLADLRDAVEHGSLLLRGSDITLEKVDALIAYAKAEELREKVEAEALRLVRKAVQAGYNYRTAQTMFCRALDAFEKKNPGKLDA